MMEKNLRRIARGGAWLASRFDGIDALFDHQLSLAELVDQVHEVLPSTRKAQVNQQVARLCAAELDAHLRPPAQLYLYAKAVVAVPFLLSLEMMIHGRAQAAVEFDDGYLLVRAVVQSGADKRMSILQLESRKQRMVPSFDHADIVGSLFSANMEDCITRNYATLHDMDSCATRSSDFARLPILHDAFTLARLRAGEKMRCVTRAGQALLPLRPPHIPALEEPGLYS